MRYLVFLTIGLLLVLSVSIAATESDNTGHRTLKQLAEEVAEFHASGAELPDRYRRPRIDMHYEVTTYAGVECEFPHKVIQESAPIVLFAWDFDSDGIIDWESKHQNPAKHAFSEVGKHYATFYAFDALGITGYAEIPVNVLTGSGEPKLEPQTIKLSANKSADKRRDIGYEIAAEPERTYFLLLADKSDDWLWTPVVHAYHRLVDSLGYSDEDIIVVAGGATGFPKYESYLEDTVIIDYRYTADGVSSALNFLLGSMTINDDLHVLSSAHGGGQADASMAIYDPDYMDHRPYEMVGGRLFADKSDPDNFVTEENFKITIDDWWNSGKLNTSVGLNEWATHWTSFYSQNYAYRVKRVVTFQNMSFVGNGKKRDDDFFIEEIKQYLAGDKDRSGHINPAKNEVWDFDGDGIPPISVVNGEYVYDEDDWGVYVLIQDVEETEWESQTIYFDDGLDGTPDVCYECLQYFPNPVAHGTDTDNDGVLDRLDVNLDGDWLDSVGVDETGFEGYDDDIAEFLDNLDYRYVTLILGNCFSGGFINDLSRPNVTVMTGTVEGTVAWSGFLPRVPSLLTGQYVSPEVPFEAAEDRVVTFQEAFNELCTREWTYDGRVRLDDNGDGVGHLCPLPDEGDGDLAAEVCWGTLPPAAQLGKPVLVWPLQDDWTYDVSPTLIWSDTAEADSFRVEWGKEDFTRAGNAVTVDTTFTIPYVGSPLPHYDLYWHVRAYKEGCIVSRYADSVSFDVLIDYSCCVGMRGNIDGDPNDAVNEDDLDYLYAFLYQGGPPPTCIPEANVDGTVGDDGPNTMDWVYLNAYVHSGGPAPVNCLGYVCGDADASGVVNTLDADFLSDYFYSGGPPPESTEAADMDCVPGLTEADLDYLVAYLWQGGPAPCDCE